MAIKRIPSGDFPVVNAKGDLIVGVSDNSASNLSVGSNSQFLQVDSTTTTGLKWTTVTPSTNWTLLNSGATSISSGATTKLYTGIGGYDKYHIEIRAIGNASSIQGTFDIAINSGTGTTATYFRRYIDLGTTGQMTWGSATFASGTTWSLGYVPSASYGMVGNLYIEGNLSTSGIKRFDLNSSANSVTTYGGQMRDFHGQLAGNPVTSILFTGSGNLNAGDVYIYGA